MNSRLTIAQTIRHTASIQAESLVSHLAMRRDGLGISRQVLAQRLNLGEAELRAWEGGSRQPDLTQTISWMVALGMNAVFAPTALETAARLRATANNGDWVAELEADLEREFTSVACTFAAGPNAERILRLFSEGDARWPNMIRRTSADQSSFEAARARLTPALGTIDATLRETLGDVLSHAKVNLGLDRHAIAAEINRIQPSDRELSKVVLDRWAAPSATDWQLPAWRVPALCAVIGDYRLLSVIVDACEHKAIPNEAAAVAEMVMLELEEKRLRERRESIGANLSQGAMDWAARLGGGRRGR